MTAPIAAVDTETTGLDPVLDEIWEFAAVRREPDGSESELHLFIEHSYDRCSKLPESFLTDHCERFPSEHLSRTAAAAQIDAFLRPGRPHVVGAVPSFDTERLGNFMRRWAPRNLDWTPPWHYHIIDVEVLAIGYLAAQGKVIRPPYKSDDVSTALGIDVAQVARHTAMGDARWALSIYDRVMGQ